MKVKILTALVVVLATIVGIQANMIHEEAAMAATPESYNFYTHGITDTGVVVRVYYRVLVRFSDWTYEWHYFGVDPAEVPPEHHTDATVYEHSYVQFPTDFSELPADGEYEFNIYQIGFEAGLWKEGLKVGP
jgi:hypothetical protein